MQEVLAKRFIELQQAGERIPLQRDAFDDDTIARQGTWEGWATSAQSLLKAVFGESGEQYKNFASVRQMNERHGAAIKSLLSIFAGAKEDFEGGYVFNVELTVSGEVFGDFVSLARTALTEGHKDVAAVLACAALEDALKRYATAN